MKGIILEILSAKFDCYISSLPFLVYKPAILDVLTRLVDHYGPEEWNYCLSYIFREEVALKNENEIRHYLEEKMKKIY